MKTGKGKEDLAMKCAILATSFWLWRLRLRFWLWLRFRSRRLRIGGRLLQLRMGFVFWHASQLLFNAKLLLAAFQVDRLPPSESAWMATRK
jgi:hypothetical protein